MANLVPVGLPGGRGDSAMRTAATSARSAAAKREGSPFDNLHPPPLKLRCGQKTCVPGGSTSCAFPRPPSPRRGRTSFSLLDRARPVCLRPKSRRFAAVGLRHAPAGAVSFSSGKKTGAPARPAAWGEEEGTEQSAVLAARRGRSGRSFFRRHGGVHCTSHHHG